MIRDLSLTLQAILSQPGLPEELAAAQIVFDRPTEPFAPSPTAVDLFLYDIRENVELRNNEPIIERLNGQARIRRPPLRVACSYLVTAWPIDGEELALQEHRLLSQVLQVLSRYPMIPTEFLQGSLVGQEPPLPMMTAQANGLQNPAEFWTAIGNKLRPSLTVTVTMAMDVLVPEDPGPIVITQQVRLGERTAPDADTIKPETLAESFRIGGLVIDAAHAPIAGATVTLVELGLTTTTDATGRYYLSRIPAGPATVYTMRVQSGDLAREVSVTVPAPAGSHYDMQLA